MLGILNQIKLKGIYSTWFKYIFAMGVNIVVRGKNLKLMIKINSVVLDAL